MTTSLTKCDLATLHKEQMNALVAAAPTKKRAALGKALRAAALHIKAGKKNYSKAFELSCSMVQNAWHLGNEIGRLKAAGLLGVGQPKKNDNKSYDSFTLSELGVSLIHSHRCQNLAKKSKAELDDWLEARYDEASYRLPTLGGAVHISENTGQPEWYTPPPFLEAACKVMGGIDLDPASSNFAQKTVKAKEFYTAEQDGLSKSWKGKTWLNPPYTSGLIDRFVAKLCEHYDARDIPEAMLLVNNATDTRWFQLAARTASAICFPSGRVRFLDDKGAHGSPLQGQALLYFGESPDDCGQAVERERVL